MNKNKKANPMPAAADETITTASIETPAGDLPKHLPLGAALVWIGKRDTAETLAEIREPVRTDGLGIAPEMLALIGGGRLGDLREALLEHEQAGAVVRAGA